ncbi:MAG TPA: hypothetical protein VFR55_01245 [Dehalococcoidia bacterium]|nr:hypothetical protein [Dehalococcoidia bacterium]
MPRFKLIDEKATRSIVFERSEIEKLEAYALSQRRSLSSLIRDAVDRYLAEVVNDHPKDVNSHPIRFR